MQTFATAAEVIDLTLDIPVYVLDHMPTPPESVVQELLHFAEHRMSLEEDLDPYWDLRLANALAVICHGRHPDALELVVETFSWLNDSSPFLQHKLVRLIETLLHPATYAPQARRWLKSMKPDQPLYLALLVLAARAQDQDPVTREHIARFWEHEALVAARLMGTSRDPAFIELLESELRTLAPYLRYLPISAPHHQPLFQHELWTEVAEAWFAIAHHQHLTPPWLDPALLLQPNDPLSYGVRQQEWQEQLDLHLLERFGGKLPLAESEWLASLGEDEQERKERFVEAREVFQAVTMPHNRKLRLVPSPSPSV